MAAKRRRSARIGADGKERRRKALRDLFGRLSTTEGRRKLFNDIEEYVVAVESGADAIEAMHGHYCGPGCWHWPYMTATQRAEANRARWAVERLRKKREAAS